MSYCVGNLSKAVAVHEAMENEKYNIGLSRIDYKLSSVSNFIATANNCGLSRGSGFCCYRRDIVAIQNVLAVVLDDS